MAVLEIILGTMGIASAAGATSFGIGLIAKYTTKRNSPVYDSQGDIDRDLPERLARYGLEDYNITAHLAGTSEWIFPDAGAEVEKMRDDIFKIRLDPSKGANTQYDLDHELAHIYRDHHNKIEKSPHILALFKYLFVYETEADLFAAGFLKPKPTKNS